MHKVMNTRTKLLLAGVFTLFFAGVTAIGYHVGRQALTAEEEEEMEEVLSNIPYAAIFKQHAPELNWDWQLLAAVCYEESRFNSRAQSASGAAGLMQLMPQTAYNFGLNDSTVFIPEHNIAAGTRYIKRLQDIFYFISNKEEQTKFVLASYNAGPAHIMDARRLAKRYGRSAYIWTDNTEYWLSQLNTEPYATDSVVLYGPCDAEGVNAYVRKVLRTYHRFLKSE